MPRTPKKREMLPDVMPEMEPSLLVVCDTHQCLFIDVGSHTLMHSDAIRSKEGAFTDHEGRFRSPAAFGKGGMTSGTADMNTLERNRLREFANTVCQHIQRMVDAQRIARWYVAAPEKFLPLLLDHLSAPLRQKLAGHLKGNFVKEAPHEILLRFRPDLSEAVQRLRDQESYSSKKHLPKQSGR